MITSDHIKKYQASKERFFKSALENFFATELPKHFGPVMRENLANEIIKLFEQLNPDIQRLKPGQVLWNALDKDTRGDSSKRRYVPVILTVIDENDVNQLVEGVYMSTIAQNSIARMTEEAYNQGGILSMRDIGLLTLRQTTSVSSIRKKYEAKHNKSLPHTGNMHDMGSCVSHKESIVKKVVLEKKDPAVVANETKHTQNAVDRYLNDFNRVRSLYQLEDDIERISSITGIAKYVVNQYLEILKEVDEND